MIKKILFFLVFSGLIMTLQARWATYDDASLKLSDRSEIATIKKDGNWESEITEEMEILKESAREGATARRLFYNEGSEKVKILEAYTVTNGEKYKVELDKIEDKPLASPAQAFDQIRQILLVYPRVQVGSKVYLKYRVATTQIPLKRHYAMFLRWGFAYYWEKSRNLINSEIPLKIKVNDPNGVLMISNNKKGSWQYIEIIQKKPVYSETVNDGSWVNDNYLTWVSLSSVKEWKDFGRLFAEGYESVLKQPLPDRFNKILIEARQKPTETAQLDTVTSLLNETLQYMGDWRTVKGRFQPRDLALVDETHIGDCKDFSTVTVAILRRLGFTAHVVFVNRGAEIRDTEKALPFYDFNHAFVKAIGKSGKVYWIDPTNVVSMAQGIFPDIAGKRAIILNSENPASEKTPEVNPTTNQVIAEKAITIQKDCSINVKGVATFKGESALEWAGKGLFLSSKAIEEEILLNAVGDYLEKNDQRTVKIPPLTNRVVEDLTFEYTYHKKNGVKRTNRGFYLNIDSPLSLTTAEEQVSDMPLASAPLTFKKILFVKGSKVENTNLLNYEIKTPWVEVKRVCKQEKDGLRIEETLIIKTRFIPAEDLVGKDYLNLKSSLKTYFDVGIVAEKP